MWLDWFPNATIYGIDIDDSNFDKWQQERLILDKVDQGDRKALLKYANEKGPWKVVLDDGGHYCSQQKTSFKVLWDYVELGGYYIIEDTHTSYWEKFMDTIETLVDYMVILSRQISQAPHYKGYYANPETRKEVEELTKYQKEIESITFYMGLIVVKKRDKV
jgi:hypothetical protein